METFHFDPIGSEKASAFLAKRADHLRTLNPAGRVVFLKSSLALARQLPLSVEENAFVKSSVLITLQRWLDEVTEAA